jgi:hypothetical protein
MSLWLTKEDENNRFFRKKVEKRFNNHRDTEARRLTYEPLAKV